MAAALRIVILTKAVLEREEMVIRSTAASRGADRQGMGIQICPFRLDHWNRIILRIWVRLLMGLQAKEEGTLTLSIVVSREVDLRVVEFNLLQVQVVT